MIIPYTIWVARYTSGWARNNIFHRPGQVRVLSTYVRTSKVPNRLQEEELKSNQTNYLFNIRSVVVFLLKK
jgi:hypothetical protein